MFAENLQALRKQKGWSQEQLADAIGVTRQTVSKWELGSTTPELEKLLALRQLFAISLEAGTSAGHARRRLFLGHGYAPLFQL